MHFKTSSLALITNINITKNIINITKTNTCFLSYFSLSLDILRYNSFLS